MGSDTQVRLARGLVAAALLVAVLPFVTFVVPQLAGADHSFVVLSSSMAPAMAAGDVVFVSDVPVGSVEQGDVIAFETADSAAAPGSTGRITHRVVDVESREGEVYFHTKGDANEAPDATPVPADRLIGQVSLVVPALGHVVLFAQQRVGLLLMVVAPSLLLVVLEVRDLLTAATDPGEGLSLPTDRSPDGETE